MAKKATIEKVKGKYENLKFSFGVYVTLIIIGTLLSAVGLAPVGWLISLAAFSMLGEVIGRQKRHFEDINQLAFKALNAVQQKGVKVEELKRVLLEMKRIVAVSPYLYWVPFIFANTMALLAIIAMLVGDLKTGVYFLIASGVGAVVMALIMFYIMHALNSRFRLHERKENQFFKKLVEALRGSGQELNVDLSVFKKETIPERNTLLYIIITIITFGLFIFYWHWTLFEDPNRHFDNHLKWEPEIVDFIEGAQ